MQSYCSRTSMSHKHMNIDRDIICIYKAYNSTKNNNHKTQHLLNYFKERLWKTLIRSRAACTEW